MNYYYSSGAGGLMYRDSVEVDEQHIPILVKSMRLVPGSGGAGRRRGGPATQVEFAARSDAMTIVNVCNGRDHAPRGVCGRAAAMAGHNSVRYPDGRVVALDGASTHELRPGEVIIGLDSGGGYGDPRLREPECVLDDVLEGWETVERARDLYCVMVTRSDDGISYQIDGAETAR